VYRMEKSDTGQTSPVSVALDKSSVDRTCPVLAILRPKSGNSIQMTFSRLGIVLSIP
jgi:hypothetical protein